MKIVNGLNVIKIETDLRNYLHTIVIAALELFIEFFGMLYFWLQFGIQIATNLKCLKYKQMWGSKS